MTLPNGHIIGDYEIIGVLGQGGMGAVYKVRNVISDRVEAMKVLLPNLLEEPGLADRFQREIKLLAKLDHANITGLRTAFRAQDQLWMVMELVDGSSLDQVLRTKRPTIGEAISYTKQALDALAYAHDMGVVHRDLKPANIILTAKGTIKLTDFGIAREHGDSRLTRTGMALGSLAYMSPEQIQRGNVDARSDLYSVGITLYELLTGRLPFDGESEFAIMSAQVMNAPKSPFELNPSIPAHLSAAIMRSLAKDPATRFQSAREFSEALDRTTPVAPTSNQRGPAMKWLIGAGAISALGVAAVLFSTRTPNAPAVHPTAVPSIAPTPVASTNRPPPVRSAPSPTPAATVDLLEREWQALSSSSDVTALNAFRERNAGTPYARKAFLRIVDVQWENVRDSKDPARLRTFVEKHPGSAHSAEAIAQAERLEKDVAVAAIKQSLVRLENAMTNRDIHALRKVWPTLAGRRLNMTAAVAKNAQSIKTSAQISGDVQVTGDIAIVPIRFQQEAFRATGEKLSVDENVTLTMRKSGDEWTIQNFPVVRDGAPKGPPNERE